MSRALTIRIDLASEVPVSRQTSLRTLLVEGQLAPGDVLPSIRRLALELGVHFNTVAQAYRDLAEEGWLDLRHGRRATVIERGRPSSAARPSTRTSQRDFQRRLREMVEEMRARGLSSSAIASELVTFAARLKS